MESNSSYLVKIGKTTLLRETVRNCQKKPIEKDVQGYVQYEVTRTSLQTT